MPERKSLMAAKFKGRAKKLLLKDTTESHCIINLLNHGLMTGTGPFNQYDRLRAASKQIW